MIPLSKESARIVFFGTPEFAVASLDSLVTGGYNVVAVVTAPDKTGGRGNRIIQSAVKQYAIEHDIPLLQPEKLRDPDFLSQLQDLKADLQIVIAFRMLPEVVWAMPPLGTFNLHASLLPKYRGAAPINWAVINGETTTGVTTFFLNHTIDTGDIIHQQSIQIGSTETVGDVYSRLMDLGAKVTIRTVDDILAGQVKPIPQAQLLTDSEPTPAPKIFAETCHIDWTRTAVQIHNLVRGLSPYPAAWTEITDRNGNSIHTKIFTTALPHAETTAYFNQQADKTQVSKTPGNLCSDGRRLAVATGDSQWIEILSLQIAGKRRMQTQEFLRGFRL